MPRDAAESVHQRIEEAGAERGDNIFPEAPRAAELVTGSHLNYRIFVQFRSLHYSGC